jgi:hypothetical protein
MTTRIKLRRDTAANWETVNPALALGEAGYDTTNNQLRVGDGTTLWGDLIPIGTGAAELTNLNLIATIPYADPIFVAAPVVFSRPNNNENTVDTIDTGITFKRKNSGGGIYNSAGGVETNWDNNQSPIGTEWNAEGWGDLADVKVRRYTTFNEACEYDVANFVTHKEFVMHDTVNDKYYTFKFDFWQPGSGAGNGDLQSLNNRSGFSYTRRLINTNPSVYFIHHAIDSTSIGDAIDIGLTLKRAAVGALYNSEDDVEWDADFTPSGTLWNDDGWYDFTDITTRIWKPFYSALHGKLGQYLVGKELLMHDTINDNYYLIKFTEWGSNNGGSFAYWRRKISPTGNKLGITFADGTQQTTAYMPGDIKIENNTISSVNRDINIETIADHDVDADINIIASDNLYLVAQGGEGIYSYSANEFSIETAGTQFRYWYPGDMFWVGQTVVFNNWWIDMPRTFELYASNGWDIEFRTDTFKWYQTSSDGLAVYDAILDTWTIPIELENTGEPIPVVAVGLRDPEYTGSKTWTFGRDGNLYLPSQTHTAYRWNYSIDGPTLKLGNAVQQVIITGADTSIGNSDAQRIIIQGQRGYGSYGQSNVAGEGGDVYLWGGTGGEKDGGQGGSGGDIKLRGGQGMDNAGGYVRIEAGSAYHNGTTYDGYGGFVDITAGDVIEGGGKAINRGGDVNITAGKAKSNSALSGVIRLHTGGSVNNIVGQEWIFNSNGTLTIPGDIRKATDASISVGSPIVASVTIDAVDQGGFGVWRLFVLDSLYPSLGSTVIIGGTITTGWGTPVTVNIVDILHDIGYGRWIFHVDADVTTGFNTGSVIASFGPGYKSWTFGGNGTTTLPGALVKSTVAKTGVADLNANDMSFEVTAVDGSGVVTEVTITNTPNIAWQSNGAGTGVTVGNLSFNVQVDGSGNATVSGITSSSGHSIGETFTTGGDSFGAEILPTAIDLTKSVNKLTNGIYSLADGVEGQIMYLVPRNGVNPEDVAVSVAHSRIAGIAYTPATLAPFRVYEYANDDYYNSTGMCTLIFTDGAWQQQGGAWTN